MMENSVLVRPHQLTVNGFVEEPFDPFSANLSAIGPEDLDDQAYYDVEIPVDLAIALFLIDREPGAGTDTSLSGLRRFSAYHSSKTLGRINSITMGNDRARITRETHAKIEDQKKRTSQMSDEWAAHRRSQQIKKRERSNGTGAWRNYRDAVATLYKFVGGFADVKSPFNGVRRAPKASNDRRALSEDEMRRLWAAALMEDDPELALLYLDCLRETAARVGAVQGLNLEDIDWTTGFATFRTKNKVIHKTCLSVDLLQRIRTRAERNGWDGHIPGDYDPQNFESVGTAAFQTASGRRISKKWTEMFFARLDRIAGDADKEKITAHWIRHTTITQVQRVLGKEAARRWAGHKVGPRRDAADQTEIYIKWTPEERVAIFNYIFPETPTGPWVPPESNIESISPTWAS